jgi:hypothetical protein
MVLVSMKDTDRYVVDTTAYTICRRLPGIPITEVREDLWRWYSEHPWLVLRLRESTSYEGELRKHLANRAIGYVHKARADKAGYKVHDLTFYGLRELRDLLEPVVMVHEETLEADMAVGSDGVADVMAAFAKLLPSDRAALTLAVIRDWDLTDDDEKRANHALREMQWVLGGPAPRPDVPDTPPPDPAADYKKAVDVVRRGLE